MQCRESQDDEADPAQQQRDPDDDPEQSEPVGHVGHVQRSRQRSLGHPEVADTVCERLLKPMTIATVPKATRIAPAIKPPHSRNVRSVSLFSRTAVITRFGAVYVLISASNPWVVPGLAEVKLRPCSTPSGTAP